MTLGICNRFKSDGSACHNICDFLDGWCREPGCDGFVRTKVASTTLKDISLLVAETEPTIQRFDLDKRKISQTNLAHVISSLNEISVNQRAIDEFKGHHGGSSEIAEQSIISLFRHCVDQDLEVLIDKNQVFYVMRYGRFTITAILTSILRIASYSTLHRERTWEQVEMGVLSRVSRFPRSPRAHPGEQRLHQLSSEEYSVVQSNLEKIVIGNVYSGTIVDATNFGVFVYLEAADRQGLIHKSSLGKFSSNNPLKDGIWIPGSQVLVSVDVIDFQKLRLGLSLVSNDDEAL